MGYNDTLQQIPVVAVPAGKVRPSRRLHWWRRASQWGTIALLVIIPVSGVFRIDPVAGAFVVLDRQIWFSDFHIVVGFWDMVACVLVLLYSIAGTVFCGWACPQGTFSEWANMMTRKLLGHRAEVSLDGAPMKVSVRKNKPLNWVILTAVFTAVAMLTALIPLFYFYPPSAVWSFVTFQEDARLAGSLHWIYTVFVLIILVNIAFIRHFMCRFMCIYKVWQHTFKTRQTLHVAYDQSRADECVRCGYCVNACFLDIDPRQTNLYDTCINCGECITACNILQAKKNGAPGLLRFEMRSRADDATPHQDKGGLSTLLGRAVWTAPLFLLGLVLFVWGLVSYEPYHFTVYRAETRHGEQIEQYRITVANKRYRDAVIDFTVAGLPEGSYRLEKEQARFTTAGRQDIAIRVDSTALGRGIYPFIVRGESRDGWQGQFRVHHVVTTESKS